jgi:hypothetical protein
MFVGRLQLGFTAAALKTLTSQVKSQPLPFMFVGRLQLGFTAAALKPVTKQV